ncbi:MAG: hypothetical protein J5845_08035 [Lachnospiraceae bacterium]|nr:hypothetical protein [Lachnospiraceae bacterium]
MILYHYYEQSTGPLRSISDLPDEEAEAVLRKIRDEKPDIFLARRPEDYVQKRRRFEAILRNEFIKMGGQPERQSPHYFVVEKCPFFEKWYEQTAWITVDTSELDMSQVTFTYGDSHPTFSGNVKDGKEYRNRLYNFEEIQKIIEKYGLPQIWNPDFKYGPECYVEVQIWTDRGLEKWLK